MICWDYFKHTNVKTNQIIAACARSEVYYHSCVYKYCQNIEYYEAT